jgi:hypothetical protein
MWNMTFDPCEWCQNCLGSVIFALAVCMTLVWLGNDIMGIPSCSYIGVWLFPQEEISHSVTSVHRNAYRTFGKVPITAVQLQTKLKCVHRFLVEIPGIKVHEHGILQFSGYYMQTDRRDESNRHLCYFYKVQTNPKICALTSN